MVEVVESAYIVYPQDTEYVSYADAAFEIRLFLQSVGLHLAVRGGRELEQAFVTARRVALVVDAAPNSLQRQHLTQFQLSDEWYPVENESVEVVVEHSLNVILADELIVVHEVEASVVVVDALVGAVHKEQGIRCLVDDHAASDVEVGDA